MKILSVLLQLLKKNPTRCSCCPSLIMKRSCISCRLFVTAKSKMFF